MEDLAPRLRKARIDQGWTLATLASRSGLSASFLSQVERGLSTLSIVSLSSICRALGIPMAPLFSSSGPLNRRAPTVTKADQQLHIRIGGSSITYSYLTRQLSEAPIKELLVAEFPADCRQDDSSHKGEEFGFMLEGALVLRVGDAEYPLAAGDSYRIAASEPHNYRTEGTGAKILMAVTQRFIDPQPRRMPPQGVP